MADRPKTRQELYERIRASSLDEVIVEEMIRLGFWPEGGTLPHDPADEIRRRGELERQTAALRTELSRLRNVEAIKKEQRKRRMAESRRRRQETKERRLRERRERAAAWQRRKATDIEYLGEGVSGGLSARESDAARLAKHGLPGLATPAELAGAMKLTVGELRFLSFARRTSRVTHYARFAIPKKTGGTRVISAPMPRLKAAQHWVLEHLLEPLPCHPAAHGFRKDRSIVSNARPHVGQAVVVNLDLKDFFPTVDYRRVRGMFRKLGYSEAVATILALLCTEPAVATVELDGATYHVATSGRVLPQGAPTSPAITNRLCRRLDTRLAGAAETLGFVYTRYADDLSFSSGDRDAPVGKLLRLVRHVVADEGFVVHPDKTRVLRRGRRQEVTGLTVNDGLGVDRKTLRRFRATLRQIELDGPAGKRWGGGRDDAVLASIVGFADFVAMVDPDKGAALRTRARALAAQYGTKPPPGAPPAAGAETADEGEPEAKRRKKWWKIF